MRCLVCSGMERAAGELLSAAETVPGVRPGGSAMVFSVTLPSFADSGFFFGGGMASSQKPRLEAGATLPSENDAPVGGKNSAVARKIQMTGRQRERKSVPVDFAFSVSYIPARCVPC